MTFPVDLSLLRSVNHMPSVPVLQRSMNCPELQLHDFCIPVNSYFPNKEVFEDLRRRLAEILRYYPSDNQTVSKQLASLLGLNAENVVVANGSTELITWINEKLIHFDLVTDVPTFGRWTDNAQELGRIVHPYYRQPSDGFRLNVVNIAKFARQRNARAMVICNPSNPTGALLSRGSVLQLLDATQHMDLVVIDESFIDFASEREIPSVAYDILERDNVIVLKSLGKNFGLHGLRCGYAVASKKMTSLLRDALPPWNVNALAEEFIRIMSNCRQQYECSRQQTVRDSRAFEYRLSEIDGIRTFPTHANFVFCQLDDNISGTQLRDVLLEQSGCFIRECGSKIGSSAQFLRIATRPEQQQRLLVAALHRAIATVRES